MRIVKHLAMFALGLGFSVPLLNCGGGTTSLTPQPPSLANAECAGVPVAAAGAAGTVYTVAAGAVGIAAQCQALAAYRAGQVVVAYNDASLLEAALGLGPATEQGGGEYKTFPYAPAVDNGVPISDPTSAPLSDIVANDPVTAYALYYDAANDVPVEFGASGPDLATVTQAVTDWARAPTGSSSTGSGSARALDSLRLEALAAPSYDTRAWTKIFEEAWSQKVNDNLRNVPADRNPQGESSGFTTIYRLNTNDATSDYFLVDATYAQGPNFVYCKDAYTCFWFNDVAGVSVSLAGYNSSISGNVLELAPTTIISKKSETLSVGGKLTGKVSGGGVEGGGEASVGWSRTIVTDSVDTTNPPGNSVGNTSAGWSDKYNHDPPFTFPNTSMSTYTADRLAIFAVPRTINDLPVKYQLVISLRLHTQFYGWWFMGFLNRHNWAASRRYGFDYTIALPKFSLRAEGSNDLTNSLSLSLKPGASASFDVVAQQVPAGKTLRWVATKTPSFVTTSIDPSGEIGNQRVTVHAQPNAAVNSVDYLNINTNPPGGADSLRNGSVRVKISITS